MRFTLTVDMGNDAFTDAPDDELARIIQHTAQKIATQGFEKSESVAVHDVNGNRVGAWKVTR